MKSNIMFLSITVLFVLLLAPTTFAANVNVILDSNNGTSRLSVLNSSTMEVMGIGSGGRVGVDTTNPTATFEVKGKARIADQLWNTFISGGTCTNGDYNTVVGDSALNLNTSGSLNTALGASAMQNNNQGYGNTAVGANAAVGNSQGINNTAIGTVALTSNVSSSYNTAVGYSAGYYTLGDHNVFIGAYAGSSETGSNKLYIANSAVNPPLIFGDFASKEVGINTNKPISTLEVNGDLRLAAMSAPTGAKGKIYLDSTTNRLNYHDGTQWIELDPAYTTQETKLITVDPTVETLSITDNKTYHQFTSFSYVNSTNDILITSFGCMVYGLVSDMPVNAQLRVGGVAKASFFDLAQSTGYSVARKQFPLPLRVAKNSTITIYLAREAGTIGSNRLSGQGPFLEYLNYPF
ncbi:MAG TPA: hypothetical protein VMD02_05700 [Candidatus Omnitrophota bacterium]|nr:hypothetical protein [Candidatus Omnitrophota bacterium]